MRTRTLCPLVCLLLVGCASGGSGEGGRAETTSAPGSTDSPADATEDGEANEGDGPDEQPEVLSEDDDGRSVTLSVGEEVNLQLAGAWLWSEPAVDGDAVTVSPVDYLTDPGFVEWSIAGAKPGEAQLRTTGEPNCDDEEQCPATSVQITVTVTS